MTNNQVPIEALLSMLKEGKIVDAQKKYFDENVETQDADGPVIKGKNNAIVALAAFMKSKNVTGFMAYEVGNMAVNGNHSFYSVVFVLQVGGKDTVRIEQAVSTSWKNGKIIKERYYHA